MTLINGSMSGNILETFVFAEILKNYWNNVQQLNIYFYRDTDQKEIDFIIEKNNKLYPIEIKKTAYSTGVKLWFNVLKKQENKLVRVQLFVYMSQFFLLKKIFILFL